MDFLKSLSQFEAMQVATYIVHRINNKTILKNIKRIVEKKLQEVEEI